MITPHTAFIDAVLVHRRTVEGLQDEANRCLDLAARIASEEALYCLSRAQDRHRHDPALAEAFLTRALSHIGDMREALAPALSEEEREAAWELALEIASDESHKDHARALMGEWGKLGARDLLNDLASVDEEGAE